MPDYASNLRRLMARDGLTLDDVVQRSRLDERTVKGLLNGSNSKPHARTLHQLAAGLDVPVSEFFQNPALLARRLFDRQTNPIVDEVANGHPELFDGWCDSDFDELYSRFGAGGELTAEGTLTAVQAMNQKRQVQRKVALLLESAEAEVLSGIVELLYQRILVESSSAPGNGME